MQLIRIYFYTKQACAIFRIGFEEEQMSLTENGHYQPLPNCLTIRQSPIAGLGLFALERIPAHKILGVTHVWVNECGGYWTRTPIGGFYNHNAEDPNCASVERIGKKFLYTLREIQPDEELTSRYTLYNPTQ
ncbi:MAG: SET domain-containing protein [Candidatus Paceibacterota bacterium]